MWTNNKSADYGNGTVLIEATCLSSDSKPTDGIANGSLVLEMDTGKVYAFDQADSQWIELQ